MTCCSGFLTHESMKQFVLRTGTGVVLTLVLVIAAPAQEGPQPSGYQAHSGREVPVAFYYPSSWTVVDADESVGIVSRPALAEQLGSDRPEIHTGDAMLGFPESGIVGKRLDRECLAL